jgi:hypothetical protein
MFGAFNELVEQRIREAMRKGEFQGLPGEGEPLRLDDDPLVPEELRMAYRVLRNAGYVPPEVEALRELNGLLGQALSGGESDPGARRASRKLLALTLALEAQGVRLGTQSALAYRQRIAERLAARRGLDGEPVALAAGKTDSPG